MHTDIKHAKDVQSYPREPCKNREVNSILPLRLANTYKDG